MNKAIAFLKLVRYPNLIFIALTQLMFQYCVLQSVYDNYSEPGQTTAFLFACILVASVLIAAAGYIINDYFDLNIDRVNKPQKVVITKAISRRVAIVWHWLLSGIGVVLTGIVSYKTHIYWLMPANFIATVLLWFYSAKFKKTNLVGNIITSLLTAWAIIILLPLNWVNNGFSELNAKQLRLTGLYAGFAFILSLIREVIKDMEDVEGDRKYGCRTMPIAWGMNAAKVFAAVWLIVLIVILIIVQIYVWQFHWLASIIYCIMLVILPLVYILKKLFTARSTADFHKLSSLVKMVMFTGILSMIFFLIYG